MHHALHMSRLQGSEYLLERGGKIAKLERPVVRDPTRKRLAAQSFHHDVGRALVGIPHSENTTDVGMLDSGQDRRLAMKTSDSIGVGSQGRMK